MSKALLIVIDGLRPDAIRPDVMASLHAFGRDNCSTDRARSVVPSITLPSHMSMFHGVNPSRHGVVSNQTGHLWDRSFGGIVELCKSASKDAAFFYNWEPLRDLSRPGCLSYSYFHNHLEDDADGDSITAREAARYIAVHRPDFAFVYFGTVDVAGHRAGWMGQEYLDQARLVDRDFAMLLKAVPDDYFVLVTTDHGGHDRLHGTTMEEDMRIFWYAGGRGVRKGHEIARQVSHVDVAPTLARALGLQPEAQWTGTCPEELFEQYGPQ